MASFVYDAYRNRALGLSTTIGTAVDLDTDNIRSFFNNDDDTAVATSDVFQSVYASSDLPTYATPHELLASPTIGVANSNAAGTFDAADAVFDGTQLISAGTSVESYILYKDSGADTTSPLILRFDSTGATGLPLTTNGASITVVYNTNGIFRF